MANGCGAFMGREWRTFFMIVYPLIILPLLCLGEKKFQCAFVVLLMAGYWITECWPLAVTATLPMILMPLMGILTTEIITRAYMKETNMMFIGGIIVATSIEHCGLHRRVSLKVILCVGCTPYRLNFGLLTATALVSMWISNSAATAMMCPVVEASLKELDNQGILPFWEKEPDVNGEKVPTRTTICYFIGCAYAASIGGVSTIVGTGTNLTFKGLYEDHVHGQDDVGFMAWMVVGVPIMIVSLILIMLWLEVLYMGLFRPNSTVGLAMKQAADSEPILREAIKQELTKLGPMKFHEIGVGFCFVITALLWLLRDPQVFPGWAELISSDSHNSAYKIKDSCAAFVGMFLMFYLPREPTFLDAFKTGQPRVQQCSDGLITWESVHSKTSWGLMFLIGGGFAMAAGMQEAGLTKYLAEQLRPLTDQSPWVASFCGCLMANLITEICSNVVSCNVVVPVLFEMATVIHMHPLYMGLPAGFACSYAWCLPVGTPPNAIIYKFCNLPTKELIIAGLGANILGIISIFIFFPWLFDIAFNISAQPDWL